jgi:3-oxoacyl-[acyl-carrier protein] reductase
MTTETPLPIGGQNGLLEVALITGASRGIGAAIAKRLASPRRAVWVNYRRGRAEAEAVARDLTDRDRWAAAIEGDITDFRSVSSMAQRIRSQHGRLDILVHNAAAALVPKPVHQLDWQADVQPHIDVCCRGFLNCLQAFGPLFGKGARVVVILTDALVHRPSVQTGAYLAGKGALWGLARAAAAEFQRRHVSFTFVSPSMTATEFLSHYEPRAIELMAHAHPLGRLASAEEVAAVVGTVVDADAGYLHGANIVVNGGRDF